MRINNISFPYPVLSYYNDDILPKLEEDSISCDSPEENAESYKFSIKLEPKNKDIFRLIARGDAVYTCEADCQRTFYRKCLSSEEPSFTIEIPRKQVRGDIVFTCLVIAKRRIIGYKNAGFNPDYENATFDIEPGELLAAFPQQRYNVDIKYDKLQSAGAFMQIRKDETGNDKVYFDISGEKIDIVLPGNLYDIYVKDVQKDTDFNAIIHSSIVFNALVYALYNIEEKGSTLWAKTIRYRMDTEKELEKFDIEDKERVPELAQVLLGDPYKRLFENLQSIKKFNEEE